MDEFKFKFRKLENFIVSDADVSDYLGVTGYDLDLTLLKLK